MGREWINSGSLIDRINFASNIMEIPSFPASGPWWTG